MRPVTECWCCMSDRHSSLALTMLHVMWTAAAAQQMKHKNARRKRRNRRRPVRRGHLQMKMPRKSVLVNVMYLYFKGHRFDCLIHSFIPRLIHSRIHLFTHSLNTFIAVRYVDSDTRMQNYIASISSMYLLFCFLVAPLACCEARLNQSGCLLCVSVCGNFFSEQPPSPCSEARQYTARYSSCIFTT